MADAARVFVVALGFALAYRSAVAGDAGQQTARARMAMEGARAGTVRTETAKMEVARVWQPLFLYSDVIENHNNVAPGALVVPGALAVPGAPVGVFDCH